MKTTLLKIALLPVVVFLMTLSFVGEWADRAYWRMFSWINKGES